MAIPPVARTPFRILALPLASAARRAHPPTSISYPLVYYYFQTPPRPASHKPNLIDRVTSKAGSTWAAFGQKPKEHWQYKMWHYGERLIDRIEFEELALSSLDPSLGPKLGSSPEVADVETAAATVARIPLLYPSIVGFSPVAHLARLLAERVPKHRKGFWVWFLAAPLTAPFMLIPIIPNLPFFYAAWRAWSHYKAWKASEYLVNVVEQGLVEEQVDARLDTVYADSGVKDGEADEEARVLLTLEGVKEITRTFTLPGVAESQLYRAVGQATIRLKEGK